MRTLYTVLYLFLLPLVLLRLLWRSKKAPAYRRRIKERFALVPARVSDAPLIWIHAVSVGETMAAVPFIEKLQEAYPEWAFCVTTTTPTGSERVRAVFGDSVLHYYLPYDIPSFVRHFVKRIRPSILIIMETELWPNLIDVCHKKMPVILANARMSEKSMRGYQSFKALTRPMFEKLTLVATQSNDDAARFMDLGVDNNHLSITGSIKYDVVVTDAVHERVALLKTQLQLQHRRIVIFASTHAKEDEIILPVIKRLNMRSSRVLGFVVPRHPERFGVVSQLCEKHMMVSVNVTDNQPVSSEAQVLIGDTMGDLLAYFGLSDIAFIGGSLVENGGHNYLEAAVWSLPIVTGPSVFNFQHVADRLVVEGGLICVNDGFALERLLVEWLEQPDAAITIGESAYDVLMANQGSLQRLVDRVSFQLDKLI